MKLEPFSDRVVIKREKAEEKRGMIIVPETAKEPKLEGIVLAVGPGRTLGDGTVVPVAAKVGDRVLFGKYAGHEFKIDGEDAFLLREDDIVGRILK